MIVRALIVFGALVACGGKTPPPATPADPLEVIRTRIMEHRAEARACYDEAHKRDAKLAGNVVINYAIEADGHVIETSQSDKDDQIQDQDLAICLGKVIEGIQFDKNPSGKATRGYHRFEFSN